METINGFYDSGDVEIKIFTARGEDEKAALETVLDNYGIKYHELIMGKPLADMYIDDKGFEFTANKKMQKIADATIEEGKIYVDRTSVGGKVYLIKRKDDIVFYAISPDFKWAELLNYEPKPKKFYLAEFNKENLEFEIQEVPEGFGDTFIAFYFHTPRGKKIFVSNKIPLTREDTPNSLIDYGFKEACKNFNLSNDEIEKISSADKKFEKLAEENHGKKLNMGDWIIGYYKGYEIIFVGVVQSKDQRAKAYSVNSYTEGGGEQKYYVYESSDGNFYYGDSDFIFEKIDKDDIKLDVYLNDVGDYLATFYVEKSGLRFEFPKNYSYGFRIREGEKEDDYKEMFIDCFFHGLSKKASARGMKVDLEDGIYLNSIGEPKKIEDGIFYMWGIERNIWTESYPAIKNLVKFELENIYFDIYETVDMDLFALFYFLKPNGKKSRPFSSSRLRTVKIEKNDTEYSLKKKYYDMVYDHLVNWEKIPPNELQKFNKTATKKKEIMKKAEDESQEFPSAEIDGELNAGDLVLINQELNPNGKRVWKFGKIVRKEDADTSEFIYNLFREYPGIYDQEIYEKPFLHFDEFHPRKIFKIKKVRKSDIEFRISERIFSTDKYAADFFVAIDDNEFRFGNSVNIEDGDNEESIRKKFFDDVADKKIGHIAE